MKSRKFVDAVTLYVRAGNGGNGAASFRREKFVPKGGPDGGDGGNGGNVILRANQDVDSLVHLFFAPHQNAGNATHGSGKQAHGRNGKDLTLDVPRGTEVWDNVEGELLADLVDHDQRFLVARGGTGGKGNVHWKTATHQTPSEQTDGEPGEQKVLRLELKLVSDIGLVGFPNAGKSSLLTRISDAHPKIGAYPFTTLNPIIGTIVFPDYTKLTVADIPGLIKGAHEGVGLGHAFLRHVERSSFLIYVIDMAGVDGRHPYNDFAILKEELELHMPDLVTRPYLVVANKMDLPESARNLEEFKSKTSIEPQTVSSITGSGFEELKAAIRNDISSSDYLPAFRHDFSNR